MSDWDDNEHPIIVAEREELRKLRAENERLQAAKGHDLKVKAALLDEIEDLKSANAVLHGLMENRDAEIERLQAYIRVLIDKDKIAAEIERLTRERDSARDAIVQKSRQYEADMEIARLVLNREIEARRALEAAVR